MTNVFSSSVGEGTYNVTIGYQITNEVLREIHESRDDLTDSFTVVADDGHGGQATADITITIVVPNRAPTAKDDTATTHVAEPVTIPVLANDADPEGDQLAITSLTSPTHGTAAISGNGITYTPEVHFCGADSFSYTISDGYGGEASAQVRVTVVDNTPPTVVTKNFTVYLDANGQATISPQDVDGGSTDNCEIASMSVSLNSFTCANLGDNPVTLTVVDTSGNQASGQATVTVVDNLPPVLTVPPNMTIECGESTDPANTGQATATDNCDPNPQISYSDTVSGACPQVITRTWTATDASSNSATGVQQVTLQDTMPPSITQPGDVTVETHDHSGTVVTFTVTATDNCDPNPVVTCNPPSGSMFPVGTTTVTCTATDACGNMSAPAQFNVTVNYMNHPPVAQADTAATDEDTAVTIAVLANDSDPDGDSLNVTSVTNPLHGTATVVGSDVRYTPDSDYTGTDTFSYTITDSDGATDSAQVNVTVEHVNHPPVAYGDEIVGSVAVLVHLNASDPDGDPLTYIIVSGPQYGYLTGTAPDLWYYFGGGMTTDWFTFKVFDGQYYSNTATVVLEDPPPDQP